MTGYRVNIAELGRLINTLEDGAQQVREANKNLAAHGQLGMLGHETLTGSAHEFEETWRYGLGKLDEAAEGVIERLHSAKRNYQELDEAHAEMYDATLPDSQPTGFPGGGWTGEGPHEGGEIFKALEGRGS
ncbi:WXG100 family type VII secretion target [Haloechinothrix halophila]|uniref:WXG100 family type VII secretion target n=1 Tax=Haloechinothrix halophila TaxID=1069073 RepID=UPI00040C80AB|nr:hypothetical protein [Haloechinothrix halophila]